MAPVHSTRNRGVGALATLIAGLLIAACGAETSEGNAAEAAQTAAVAAPDEALLMLCGEARGALLELDWMLNGRKRLDVGTLGSDAFLVNRLAEHVTPSLGVRQDIDQWRQSLDAWTTSLRAMPPNITNGRLIEPDTSGLDRTLVEQLRPIGGRLGEWHARVCKA